MTNEELRKCFETYTSCWKFFKDYCNTQGTDEEIERAILVSEELYKRYNSKLARELIVATMTTLDHEWRKKGV